MVTLKGSVGRNGNNLADDVHAVQSRLNVWLAKTEPAPPPLAESGSIDDATMLAILNFQTRIGMKTPDGKIDPGGNTWKQLDVHGNAQVNRLSGAAWWHANQAQFGTITDVADLNPSFRPKVEAFLAALKKAGAQVRISTTFRSSERAHLMHYSWEISKGDIQASAVDALQAKHYDPAIRAIDIVWDHGSKTASIKAAREMVSLFDIDFRPSLNTRHAKGLAIDMKTTWSGTLTIQDKNGKMVSIGAPQSGAYNTALHRVGASYGVIKNTADRPHWSDNGH